MAKAQPGAIDRGPSPDAATQRPAPIQPVARDLRPWFRCHCAAVKAESVTLPAASAGEARAAFLRTFKVPLPSALVVEVEYLPDYFPSADELAFARSLG